MAYNHQHYETFVALLQFWGLPPEVANLISEQLADIDNDAQDELIKILTTKLHKKQIPQPRG
jgi:hypothetical protein